MSAIPTAVTKRLISAVPTFKKILTKAKERDVNESDTVTIVVDMLDKIFGFDRYAEITKEYSIQGTYCDLAIKTEKGIEYLIEVKSIGIELQDKHLRQAVNYAAREGIQWIVLTNGIQWQIHRVFLEPSVRNERLFTIDLETINPRQKDHQELLFLLCKRGVAKDLIGDYYKYKQSVNRYTIGALLLTDAVVSVVRRELRKFKPAVKVNTEYILELIQNEVIKREILESETGIDARKQLARHIKRAKKTKTKETESPAEEIQSAYPQSDSETEAHYGVDNTNPEDGSLL